MRRRRPTADKALYVTNGLELVKTGDDRVNESLLDTIDKYRKAIVAFLVPFLASTLLLVADVAGAESNIYIVLSGYATSVLTLLGVRQAPNKPQIAGAHPGVDEPQSHPAA